MRSLRSFAVSTLLILAPTLVGTTGGLRHFQVDASTAQISVSDGVHTTVAACPVRQEDAEPAEDTKIHIRGTENSLYKKRSDVPLCLRGLPCPPCPAC